MASLNALTLIGRLTRDPEAKAATQSGMSITKFAVAVDRKSGSKEDRKTDFFDVTCFGKTADFVANYLSKGNLVAVNGRVEINKVPAREGEGTVTFVDVVANSVENLTPKDNQETSSKPAEPGKEEDPFGDE